MKKWYTLFIVLVLCCVIVEGQGEGVDKLSDRRFIIVNSGLTHSLYGFKVGYLADPGAYMGFRLGRSTEWSHMVAHNRDDLVSMVAGFTNTLLVGYDFSVALQFGVGIGSWMRGEEVDFPNSGLEVEFGLLIRKNHFISSFTGNYLFGSCGYPGGDLCLGLGYAF